jgi:quinolinate synthase
MTASQALDETLPDDLEGEILRLKQERNAILLAHFYQESEVQDLADVVGDSLALAQAATRVEKDVIVFCGVNFMAETAKILNPTRKVVVPDLIRPARWWCRISTRAAPCPMAAQPMSFGPSSRSTPVPR